jgi:hypothetical protein
MAPPGAEQNNARTLEEQLTPIPPDAKSETVHQTGTSPAGAPPCPRNTPSIQPVGGALTLPLIAFFAIEGVVSILYALEHRRELTGR